MSENVNIWNKLKSSSFCFTIDSMGEWNVSANKIAWLLLSWCLLRKMLTSHHIIDEGSWWWVRSEIILTANEMNGVEKSCVWCGRFSMGKITKVEMICRIFYSDALCMCDWAIFISIIITFHSMHKGGIGKNGGKNESSSKNKSAD